MQPFYMIEHVLMQVFEDTSGCIVVSFHRDLAAHEGDITSYMNQHYRTDLTVQTFKLVKDAVQWGILSTLPDNTVSWGVFYVYWPPWASRPKVIPPHLAGPRPVPKGGTQHLVKIGSSSREPFGQRTGAGKLQQFNTRPQERSMGCKGSSLFGLI
jgi:hypothetical protein